MLWLINDNHSHEIVSCNTHKKDGMFQLWVTRTNGKNLLIIESKDEEEVLEVKEAIDWAIENGERALRLA